jgi:hypothetical protein
MNHKQYPEPIKKAMAGTMVLGKKKPTITGTKCIKCFKLGTKLGNKTKRLK